MTHLLTHPHRISFRPIRDSRHGYNGFELAPTKGPCGPAAAGGSPAANAHLPGVHGHHEVRDGARAGGLPVGGLLQPESEPVPREEFLHCALRQSPADDDHL